MNQAIVKTTCPYCGVGCGIEAVVEDAERHIVTIKGDPAHPANFGKLCAKGAMLGETVSLENRLLHPEINGRRCDWDSALNHVADGFNAIIDLYGPDAVAFYVSGQLLTEDYYVANKLMKGFIGSANIDTNSRLCMSSAVAGYKRAFGADVVPCNYEDLELAELIVLVGSNAAWCHPVAFQRIRKAKENNPALKVVVIDPRATASCDIADLHLPVKPGMDGFLFNGLLAYLHQTGKLDHAYIDSHTEGLDLALRVASETAGDLDRVAGLCHLAKNAVKQLYDWFADTEKTVSVYSQGINQSHSGADKCNAIINCHLAGGKIGKPGAGPFSFTGQPNAMGGREVGGLANMLAAQMDLENPEHVDRVGRFWQAPRVADRQGLKALEMFDGIASGKIKAVWIMATNPVVSMPDADRVSEALRRCPLVVVSDCIGTTDTVDLAHVRLPATGWSEKNGTVTNLERRISRQRPLFAASGEARPDWWIISQVASRMGFGNAFSYRCSADIFREHAALSGFENGGEFPVRAFNLSALADIGQNQFDTLQPVQWPVTVQQPGTARLCGDGSFYTANRKARFVPIVPRPSLNSPDAEYPYTLNTGRLRDQWHTMTRTGLVAKLNAHRPEPFVEIHPGDAQSLNLTQGCLARIESRWGNMLARVEISANQQAGSLFVPMHWSGQLSSRGRVGAVVNPVADPVSGQPESKQTPVKISVWPAGWQALILSREPLSLPACTYRVSSKGNRFWRYQLADQNEIANIQQWSRKFLATADNDTDDAIEYADLHRGDYRSARFDEGQLQSCFFFAAVGPLPEPEWLTTLFTKSELSRQERLNLLSGMPPLGEADVGRTVCSCFNVGEKTILAAIETHKLTSSAGIGLCVNAGTGCGSCLPELKELLAVSQSGENS